MQAVLKTRNLPELFWGTSVRKNTIGLNMKAILPVEVRGSQIGIDYGSSTPSGTDGSFVGEISPKEAPAVAYPKARSPWESLQFFQPLNKTGFKLMHKIRSQQQISALDPAARMAVEGGEPVRLPRHCCVRQAAVSHRGQSGQIN